MTGDKNFKKIKEQKGFTLMEILITTAIFVTVITIVSSVYLTIASSQRRAFGQQNVIDGARFALESVSRAIRQSEVVSFTPPSTLVIQHPVKGTITYTRSGDKILENGGDLTPSKISISGLFFTVSGIPDTDGIQPRVTILVVATSESGLTNEGEETSLTLQTTVTPRKLQTP